MCCIVIFIQFHSFLISLLDFCLEPIFHSAMIYSASIIPYTFCSFCCWYIALICNREIGCWVFFQFTYIHFDLLCVLYVVCFGENFLCCWEQSYFLALGGMLCRCLLGLLDVWHHSTSAFLCYCLDDISIGEGGLLKMSSSITVFG